MFTAGFYQNIYGDESMTEKFTPESEYESTFNLKSFLVIFLAMAIGY